MDKYIITREEIDAFEGVEKTQATIGDNAHIHKPNRIAYPASIFDSRITHRGNT